MKNKFYYTCAENGKVMQTSTFDKKLSRIELSEFKKLYRKVWGLPSKVKVEIVPFND